MEKYRIIQYNNGRYSVQKKMRLFGFGPKVWYTYVEQPDHCCDNPSFTLIRSLGETYEYLDDAMKIIERERKRDKHNGIDYDELLAFLTSNRFDNAFEGCARLTTAPTLPAPTLAQRFYERMFENMPKCSMKVFKEI